MTSASPADGIREMLQAYPDLVELYPLNAFLQALLRSAQPLAGGSPVGCFVAKCRRLAILKDDAFYAERVSQDVGEALTEACHNGGAFPARAMGGTESPFADLRELQVVPCSVVTRCVGGILLPVSARRSARLALLVRLASYYLHRDAIEREIQRLGGPWAIMGCSPWMFQAQEDLERFSHLREPVLITGESGSGKEVFAQAVHVLSPRHSRPFVSVNCAAAPSENLLLDEFFGHRKGAFSGAFYDKDGCCQQAHSGTLFLDEIGEMSHELQTLLLRTITKGEVRRLGDDKIGRVDVRLVSATHRDLVRASQDRTFRADLYYRISAFQLHIPALRERVSDIRYLASFTLHSFAHVNRLEPKHLTEAAQRKLETYYWFGNIRELENVLKRAFVLTPGTVIDAEHLRFDSSPWVPVDPSERLLFEIRHRGHSFWEAAYQPFMRRELTRVDLASLLDEGLRQVGGKLKDLAAYLNVRREEQGRFVAFLHRHGFRTSDGWPPFDGSSGPGT